MAIANFFDKVSLSASQVLKNYNRSEFEKLLNAITIQISFDEAAAESREGCITLDFLIRLISRLYPYIYISGPKEKCNELETLARSINPAIDIRTENVAINIVVGSTHAPSDVLTFYIGSDGWDCKLSRIAPVVSKNSTNPLGAAAAACFGAANVFRVIFQNHLTHGELDNDFTLSLLDLKQTASISQPDIKNLDIHRVHLVGLGAIGNSFLYVFKNLPGVKGEIVGIDPEKVAKSNLQRYVLTDQSSIEKNKVKLIQEFLKDSNLLFDPHKKNWAEYFDSLTDQKINTIAVCVDNATDRILTQAALPFGIFNAWTQPDNIGISQHLSFGKTPCLSCLYIDALPRKNRSQEIADNLNIPHLERLIRGYLANEQVLDQNLLNIIKQANNLQADPTLDSYLGQNLNIFYSEVVCGGLLMNFATDENSKKASNIDVPSAFESAMAGILLAAAIIKKSIGFSTDNESESIRINLMRPLATYLFSPECKIDNCICTDNDYVSVYNEKWGMK